MGLKSSELSQLLNDGADPKQLDWRKARLKGHDLSGMNLDGVNLSGANLAGARLAGASLKGCNLTGARLQDADLSHADLSGADLRRARLKGTNLTEATLDGARLVRLGLGETLLKGASLIGADLTEGDLARGHFEDANFEKATLTRATLDSATLLRVNLTSADLEEAYLERARLEEVDLSGARLHRANLVQAHLEALSVDGAVFTEADMAEATVRRCRFDRANLSNAILDQATVAEVDFEGAEVTGADLQGISGLSPEDLEALQSRGAVIHALALSKMIDALVGNRAVRLLGGAAAAIAVGFFFYYYTQPAQQPMDAVLEQARTLRQADDPETALQLYDTLLAKVGEDSEEGTRLQYLRAETLMEMERAKEASDIYRQLAEHDGADKDEAITAKLRLISVQIEQGELTEAIPALTAIADDPDAAPTDVARALIALSSVYERMGFNDKAIAVAEGALTKYPDRPVVALEVNRHIANLLIQRQDYDRAEALLNELEDVVHDDSDRAELLMSRARLYEEKGDPTRSLEVMQQLVTDYPDNPEVSPEVRYELASLLAERGEVEQAQRILQGLITFDQGSSLGHQAAISLARIQAGVGRNLQALELLLGLRDEPDLLPEDKGLAMLAEAEILARLGKRTQALDLLTLISTSSELGQIGPALLMQAQVQMDMGDLAAAERTYAQILRRFAAVPDMSIAALMGQATLKERQGQWAQAQTQYETALQQARTADERSHIYERLGNARLQQGDVEGARETWLAMQAQLPEGEGQARASFGLAQLAAQGGDVDGATALYREVANTTQDPNIRSIALTQLAQLYVERGRLDEAKLTFQEIVDRVPAGHDSAFSARMGLAHLYARQREVEQAFKLYRAAVDGTALAAQQAEGLLAVGRLQLDSGAFAEAQATFEGVAERFASRQDTVDEANLGLAQVHRATGEQAEALGLYRLVAEQSEDPNTVSTALGAWAAILEEQGHPEAALKVQRQILKRFGDDPEASFQAHLASASAKIASGDLNGAITAYQELLKGTSDPGLRVQILDGMARAQHQGGALEDAATTYERLIKEAKDDPDFLHNALMGLAGLRAAQDRREDARALYGRVAKDSADKGLRAWAMESMAKMAADDGDYDKAQEMYEEILDRFEDDPTVTAGTRLGLGQLKRASDDLSGARALFGEVAQSASDPSQRTWAMLYLAQVLIEEGSDEAGLEALLSLINDHPDDAEVLLNARLSLAALYRARGRSDEALDVYRAVASGGGYADYRVAALEGLAGISMDSGDHDKARKAYQETLDRFGTNPEARFLAKLGLARVSMAEGVEGAQQAVLQLKELLPTAQDPVLKAWATQALAQAHIKAGEASQAAATYRLLIEDDAGMADLQQEARRYLDSM